MSISLSQRGVAFPDSPMRKLSPFSEAATQAGKKIYHLNIGQPDLPSPEVFRRAVADYDQPVFAYSRSEGLVPTVEAWRAYYARVGHDLSEKELLVTTGGSEALLFAFQVLCDHGDEVLVPEPCYPGYRTFAAVAGVKLVPIRTRVEDGYHLPSRGEIEALITPRTKILLMCNPSNPTGAVYTPEEVRMLGEICQQRDLFLVSDEVYREFLFDDVETVGALDLEDIRDRVVICDSVSKRWSSCGIRIGAMVSRNTDVIAAALRIARGRLSAPLLGQVAVATVAPELDAEVQGNVEEYRRRRDAILGAVQRIPGVVAPMPKGAFYVMLRLPVDSSETFARWLLTDFEDRGETVMVSPGPGFYITPGRGEDEVRFAFVLKVPDIERSAEILARALEVYPGRVD